MRRGLIWLLVVSIVMLLRVYWKVVLVVVIWVKRVVLLVFLVVSIRIVDILNGILCHLLAMDFYTLCDCKYRRLCL